MRVESSAEIRTFDIAVLPGDGIGVDVTIEALRVLEAVQAGFKAVRLEFKEHAAGAAEYLEHGDPLPEAVLGACTEADAVLLGAMGLPNVRWPDGTEMTPQLDLREKLDLYCGLRPIYLYHESDTPLKGHAAGEIDLLIVRENCEGLFSSRLSERTADASAVKDVLLISRQGAERIARAAFEQAMQRRRKLTLVDKANVLPSMAFFRTVFDEVAREFPEVEAGHMYVDAAALHLVKNPRQFDVIVTENMFGDILSDLAAGLVGGMGMAPSADIGQCTALFQPSHGTAPDIAGLGIANPVATILSAAMLLEWLGLPETVRGAGQIRCAVRHVLSDPRNRTPEMGGRLTTAEMGARVIAALGH